MIRPWWKSDGARAFACFLHAGVLLSVVALVAAIGTAPPAGATATMVSHADAERARDGVLSGDYVPLEQIIADAQARYPGRIVEVELDDDEYEVEILLPDGTKVELEYDARSGEFLGVEQDD
jgi:uncharacterized membrane protein YkoI